MERNLSRILSLYVSVVLGASGAVYSRERLGASPVRVGVCVSLAMYPGARRRWDHDLATRGTSTGSNYYKGLIEKSKKHF